MQCPKSRINTNKQRIIEKILSIQCLKCFTKENNRHGCNNENVQRQREGPFNIRCNTGYFLWERHILSSTKPKCDARLLLNLPILYVILLQLIEYESDPYFLPASQSATIRDQLLIYLFCKGCKPEVIWTYVAKKILRSYAAQFL